MTISNINSSRHYLNQRVKSSTTKRYLLKIFTQMLSPSKYVPWERTQSSVILRNNAWSLPVLSCSDLSSQLFGRLSRRRNGDLWIQVLILGIKKSRKVSGRDLKWALEDCNEFFNREISYIITMHEGLGALSWNSRRSTEKRDIQKHPYGFGEDQSTPKNCSSVPLFNPKECNYFILIISQTSYKPMKAGRTLLD